jgi:hypothetical protein
MKKATGIAPCGFKFSLIAGHEPDRRCPAIK